MLTLTKRRPATQAFGRGMDNHRNPAQWNVVDEYGFTIAVLTGNTMRQYDVANWKAWTPDFRLVRDGFASRRGALAFVESRRELFPDSGITAA